MEKGYRSSCSLTAILAAEGTRLSELGITMDEIEWRDNERRIRV